MARTTRQPGSGNGYVYEFPSSWKATFEAVQRCCDRLRNGVLLSADQATGRVTLVLRTTLSVVGATLVVDVEDVPDTGSRVRIWGMLNGPITVGPVLNYHVRKFLKALTAELAAGTQETG